MPEMHPLSDPLVRVGWSAVEENAWQGIGPGDIRDILAAVLPLHREQIAAELEAYAESIGWYEDGGVWADALVVIRQEPWTRQGAGE